MQEGVRGGLRILRWGLGLFLVLMLLFVQNEIARSFLPPTESPPIAFADVPPALPAANCLLLLLPLGAILLTTFGLTALRAVSADAWRRITWRVGSTELSPFRVAGLFLVALALSYFVGIGLSAMEFLAGARPRASWFASATFSALLVTLGWFLIVAATRALEPFAQGRESLLLQGIIIEVSVFALLLIGATFVATAMLPADTPDVAVPPSVPGISIPAAVGAVAGLALLQVIARRAERRIPRSASVTTRSDTDT